MRALLQRDPSSLSGTPAQRKLYQQPSHGSPSKVQSCCPVSQYARTPSSLLSDVTAQNCPQSSCHALCGGWRPDGSTLGPGPWPFSTLPYPWPFSWSTTPVSSPYSSTSSVCGSRPVSSGREESSRDDCRKMSPHEKPPNRPAYRRASTTLKIYNSYHSTSAHAYR